MSGLSYSPGEGKMSGKREFYCAQLFGALLFIVGLVAGLLIGIYVYHGGIDTEVICKNIPENIVSDGGEQTTSETPRDDVCHTCERRQARMNWTGEDPEIFAPLTSEEMSKVRGFLLTEQYIDDKPTGGLKSNYLRSMILSPPEKEAVRKYKAGTGPYPGRYVEAHVVRGKLPQPDYMQYKIGPVNKDTMTVQQLYADGELDYNSRPYDGIEISLYHVMLKEDFNILEALTKESFDGAFYSDENSDFSIFFFNGPPGVKSNERETRFSAYFNPYGNEAEYIPLDVLPLSGSIHCPGTDTSEWYVYNYYYLNQGPFQNASALMEAYNNGSLRKISLQNGHRQTVRDRSLPDRDTGVPFRHNSNIPPPRTYEPEGPRYTIKGHNVDWMGWNFDVTTSYLRGPGLFEITFQNNNIAYEISLNEIAVVYGSGSSGQTNIIYADSMYGIGGVVGNVRDVDCPEHATMLETTHWDEFSHSHILSRSICVYEADGENALWRHRGYAFEGGLRNNFLVVRLSSTVGNYDYIIEWHFTLDGKIFTIVSASGYIQGTFWDDNNPFMGDEKTRDSFGYRVNLNTRGPIHDHMIGFKVDLDILGTENTMEVIHWKTGDVMSALKSQVGSVSEVPAYFLINNTRYIEYEEVERETGYRINMEEPKFWIVKNENERNEWGVQRGYEIKPISTASQTLTDAHPAMPALSFSKYHCAVTKRKESEQFMTSTTDTHRLNQPVGYFEKQLNNEYIKNTDIVNWVTVGFLHVPTSEDVPMTARVESGFMLKPFNFFDKTPVFDIQAYLDTRTGWKTERPPKYKPCAEKGLE
ncbi:hypothetical protein ACF0H5_015860 [Mactra antiquata]